MKIIDLSMPIYHGMKVYPGDPEVSVEQVHTYQTHGCKLSKITMGTHTGTHVDAFVHMDEQGKSWIRFHSIVSLARPYG
jgi:kynurenine formamidase